MSETKGQLVADKHLRRKAVEEMTDLSRSTIYDLMSKKRFPRPNMDDLRFKYQVWPHLQDDRAPSCAIKWLVF